MASFLLLKQNKTKQKSCETSFTLTRVSIKPSTQTAPLYRVSGDAEGNYSGIPRTILDKPGPSYFLSPLSYLYNQSPNLSILSLKYLLNLVAPFEVAINVLLRLLWWLPNTFPCSQSCKFPIYFSPNRELLLIHTFNHLILSLKILQWSGIFKEKV